MSKVSFDGGRDIVRAQIYKRTAQYVSTASKGPNGDERTEQDRSTLTKQLTETYCSTLPLWKAE